MEIEIHKLDIDKYVWWLFELSNRVNSYDEQRKYMNRLLLASYSLHTRHLINSKNKTSKKLSDYFSVKARQIDAEQKEISHYTDDRFNKLWFFPDRGEWQMISLLRKTGLEEDIKTYTEKLKYTVISELDFTKKMLADVRAERTLSHLDYYLDGNVLPNDDGGTQTRFWYDLNTIDFIKYLHKRIEVLEQKPAKQKVFKSLTDQQTAKVSVSLALDEIALICYYNNREVTRANAQSISNEYGNPANSNVLYNKFNHCKYAPNRTGTDTEIKVSNRLKKMERIKPYIKDKKLFNKELAVLRNNANEAFPLTFPI
jgi:hypothetical protein